MAKPILTAARLREVLSYDPETGIFTWLESTSNIRAGDSAGTKNHVRGYVSIKIDGGMHKAHRLAFLYMTGDWPPEMVDHIDMQRSNNRWANLRLATRSENHFNVPVRRDNKTGIKGVCWHKPSNKYIAQARVNGKHYYLGIFADKHEAGRVYQEFARKHHGDFLHGSA